MPGEGQGSSYSPMSSNGGETQPAAKQGGRIDQDHRDYKHTRGGTKERHSLFD